MTPVETPRFDLTSRNERAIPGVIWRDAPVWAVPVAVLVTLVLGLTVLSSGLGWVIAAIIGILVGAGVAAGRTIVLRNAAPAGLTQVVGGQPVTPSEQPRLVNLLEGLCVTSGVAEPELRIVHDRGANVAVFGGPHAGVIVVTSGLVDALGRVELEGVLAECLWRIRTSDAELAGLVATFRAGPALRATGATPPNGWDRRRDALAAPFDGHRHLLADQGAVSLTRYPPGLARALERMEGIGTAVTSATWGTAHLWICPPMPGGVGDSGVDAAGFPPTGLRVDALAEL
jgi:heat shock protein HtpX